MHFWYMKKVGTNFIIMFWLHITLISLGIYIKQFLVFSYWASTYRRSNIFKYCDYLQENGIQNNIFSITFHNATTNTAVTELFNWPLKSPIGNNLFHVRCVYHIINLIIQDRLKMLEEKIQKVKTCHHVY